MMTKPPSPSAASGTGMTDEHATARLKRASNAVDEHNQEVALRLLIEVVQALVDRASAAAH